MAGSAAFNGCSADGIDTLLRGFSTLAAAGLTKAPSPRKADLPGFAGFATGGGVVYDSDPEAEYQETVNKSRALRRAAEDAGMFTRKGNL